MKNYPLEDSSSSDEDSSGSDEIEVLDKLPPKQDEIFRAVKEEKVVTVSAPEEFEEEEEEKVRFVLNVRKLEPENQFPQETELASVKNGSSPK